MPNRIAVFNDGVIQQLASPNDWYERPDNTFVAQLIGENNNLSGTVRELRGKTCLVDLDAGGQVRALSVNIYAVGSRSTLSLRPERVAVNPKAGSFPNLFDAEIRELI